jgi:hypothetical protein
MKIEETDSFKTLVDLEKAAWHCIPEDGALGTNPTSL